MVCDPELLPLKITSYSRVRVQENFVKKKYGKLLLVDQIIKIKTHYNY